MTDTLQTDTAEDGQTAAQASPEAGKAPRKLRPLLTLVPFAMRYRGRIALALLSLLVAALATLAVPLAARRMIDFGFSTERIGLIDQYFGMMIVVAGVLALASASALLSL